LIGVGHLAAIIVDGSHSHGNLGRGPVDGGKSRLKAQITPKGKASRGLKAVFYRSIRLIKNAQMQGTRNPEE
jgi:hypothetical protein